MIKPLNDYVVIKPLEKEKNVGGIIFSNKNNSQDNVGLIVSLGNKHDNNLLKENIKVIFKKELSNVYTDELNNEFYIIKEEDIIAILED